MTSVFRGFIVCIFFLLLNEGLFVAGLPSLKLGEPYVTSPVGVAGLYLSGALGAAVLALASSQIGIRRSQQLLVLGLLALFTPLLLSSLTHGSHLTLRLACLGLASMGLFAASALAGPRFLGRFVVILGAIWSWGSILVWASSLIGVTSVGGLDPDLSGRYRAWTEQLGLTVPDNFGALIGLSTSRQVLGPSLAILLIVLFRTLRPSRCSFISRPLWIISTVGSAIALALSLSRVSLIALGCGVAISMVPWGSVKSTRIIAALLAVAYALLLCVPLLIGSRLPAGYSPTNTLDWRLSIWQQYLNQSQVFYPFGAGPEFAFSVIGNTHNLLLEVLGSGGLVGVIGLLSFIGLWTHEGLRVSDSDGGGALGVWTVLMITGSMQTPLSTTHYAMGFIWALVLMVFGGSTSINNKNRRSYRDARPVSRQERAA